MKSRSKSIGREEALSKAMRYCAFQERSASDVRRKLSEWGLCGNEDVWWVTEHLKKEKFIDDQRYAIIFAKSKLQQNRWGKRKIEYALKKKEISDAHIRNALDMLNDQDYENILLGLAREKVKETGLIPYEQKAKLIRFLLQRGFEIQLIETVIHKIKSEL